MSNVKLTKKKHNTRGPQRTERSRRRKLARVSSLIGISQRAEQRAKTVPQSNIDGEYQMPGSRNPRKVSR